MADAARSRVLEALAAHGAPELESASWNTCKENLEAYQDTAVALLCAFDDNDTLSAKIRAEEPARALAVLARARRPKKEKNEKIEKFVQVYGDELCKSCGNKTVRKRFASARAADEGQVCYFVCHTCKAQWRSG